MKTENKLNKGYWLDYIWDESYFISSAENGTGARTTTTILPPGPKNNFYQNRRKHGKKKKR